MFYIFKKRKPEDFGDYNTDPEILQIRYDNYIRKSKSNFHLFIFFLLLI